jgi:hypothetical protein
MSFTTVHTATSYNLFYLCSIAYGREGKRVKSESESERVSRVARDRDRDI